MPKRPLSDYVKVTHGFAFPGENFTDEPTCDLLLTPGNFAIGGGFQMGKGKYYRGSVPPEYVLPAGELVVTMTDLSKTSDTLGYPAIVPELPGVRVLHNQRVGRVVFKDTTAVSKRFLYYLMCTREYRHEILASATGTGVKHTAPVRIEAFKCEFPPLPEQRAIAGVLGALDDKIEVNRKTARVLEGIARAVFTSWFVDFDPVRRHAAPQTAAGAPLPPDLAALFPKRLVNSPIGDVPEGWRVGTIKDFASRIQYGLTQSASVEPIGPRFLRITDIQGGRVDWWTVPYCAVSQDDLNRYKIVDGDILVARTGASTGENIYIVEPPTAVFASYLVRFQFADSAVGRIIAEFMRTAGYLAFIDATLGGSAQPNANAQTLAAASLVLPPSPIASAFHKLIRPLDLKRVVNSDASATLAALRDALLPKLISGELRIADAEKIVGRAT